MSGSEPVVVGIDVGTQGARVVAHDATGVLVASESERFTGDWASGQQDPALWWQAVVAGLVRLVAQIGLRQVAGIAVTSTSGTVVPLDRTWQPLVPALMYDDRRAVLVAALIEQRFPELGANVSWGLPKIFWFEQSVPELAERIHAWRHPADLLIGWLTGAWEQTDQTTALKSGYDLVEQRWPDEMLGVLGIDPARLPAVGRSGTVAGHVHAPAAAATGLPLGTPVLLGMTDGCASQVAAGAVRPGSWNATIGTTLVVKGTTVERVTDPLGRIYAHRHPEGYWMPGAASNTGAGWIPRWFPDRDPAELDRLAAGVVPTGAISYPLVGEGERFPFFAPSARAFESETGDETIRYAAALEGVAYLERMAFELIEESSGERVASVATAGGGSAGDTWLRIRSNVLERPIRKVRHGQAATGAAIIAASGVWFGGLIEAAEAMVELERVVEPDRLVDAYRDGYLRFQEALAVRGYRL